jgi:hypothetical protein
MSMVMGGRRADLQAAEILGLGDRALAVGDVADAVVPPAEGDEPDSLKALGEFLADVSIHYLVRGGRIRKQERQAERREFGQDGGGGALTVHRHIERAGPQGRQHRGVVAELGGAGHAHLDAAVAALLQQRGEALGSEATRVAGRGAVAECEANRRLRPQDGRSRKGTCRAEQNRPSRGLERRHVFLPENDRLVRRWARVDA